MKKLTISAIIVSLLLLSGCAKGLTQNGSQGTKGSQTVESGQNNAAAAQNGANKSSPTGTSPNASSNATTKAVKAPPLNATQKAQVNEKVTTVINSLNDVVKNLKEAQDIDLSGI